mmetsp:Transcript_10131/g.29762  ORF Transcript_10131/g.29762 Transcript_10131/m.29762 type:complete len:279 (-) Transcript_10131:232-1068(-)
MDCYRYRGPRCRLHARVLAWQGRQRLHHEWARRPFDDHRRAEEPVPLRARPYASLLQSMVGGSYGRGSQCNHGGRAPAAAGRGRAPEARRERRSGRGGPGALPQGHGLPLRVHAGAQHLARGGRLGGLCRPAAGAVRGSGPEAAQDPTQGRLQLPRAEGSKVARRARAPGRRRGAQHAAVPGPGHERGHPRRREHRVEAGAGAEGPGNGRSSGQLRAGAEDKPRADHGGYAADGQDRDGSPALGDADPRPRVAGLLLPQAQSGHVVDLAQAGPAAHHC